MIYTGKVLSIDRDPKFRNKRIAKVDIQPDPMYFFVRIGMRVSPGDTVELHKDENSFGYTKIVIIFAENKTK